MMSGSMLSTTWRANGRNAVPAVDNGGPAIGEAAESRRRR